MLFLKALAIVFWGLLKSLLPYAIFLVAAAALALVVAHLDVFVAAALLCAVVVLAGANIYIVARAVSYEIDVLKKSATPVVTITGDKT